MKKSIRRSEPVFSLWESLLVLAGILGLLGFLIIIEHQEPQAPLLIAFVLLMVYGRLRGFSWNTIMAGVRTGLRAGVDPLVIFLTIGVLIATWIFSGDDSDHHVRWLSIDLGQVLFTHGLSGLYPGGNCLWEFVYQCLHDGHCLHRNWGNFAYQSRTDGRGNCLGGLLWGQYFALVQYHEFGGFYGPN